MSWRPEQNACTFSRELAPGRPNVPFPAMLPHTTGLSRGHMHRLSRLLLLIAPVFSAALACRAPGDLSAGASSPRDSPTRLPPDSVFRLLVLVRLQAFGRGDSAAYARLLADDVVHINDYGMRRSRVALLAHVAANNGGAVRYDVSALHARLVGTAAVVDCEVRDYHRVGSREIRNTARELDVFREEAGEWKLLAHAETPELTSPAALDVGAASLQDYVGVYEWWPGFRETYTAVRGQLFVQASGDSTAVPLRAAAPDAFFVPGDASIILFARDASGRVRSILVHSDDGQLDVVRRVR